MKRNNKAEIATSTIIIVAIIVGTIGGGYVAKDAGYLPWFESPITPPGIEKENVFPCPPGSDACKDAIPDTQDGCSRFFNLISEKITFLKGKNYVVEDTPAGVVASYKAELTEQGYRVFNEFEGTTQFAGYDEVHYLVMFKGITLAVVLATNVSATPGTCVYYGVGSLISSEAKGIENISDLTP